ncbi:GDSL-type esterase/lipase family protein [Nitriliruptor alkaliphilus]|uniref:GDSL-type esterase/lipase family protein n=1 Tax=Nitriliruptor alkaliphilus TaxID=427918 RepID=UPI00069823F1|nr:GDSL-type esterase/lipase family protein [Nitriliruptor alkaliphilus]
MTVGVASGLVLMVTAVAARRTAGQIRAMREAGLSVPALHHDVLLPGRGHPLRLTVIGDSAAAGHGLPDADAGLARQVGRRLAARTGRPVEVASLAVDGATTADVAEGQVPAIGGDADVVLVGVGVNDAVRGRSKARVRAATEALLADVAVTAPGAVVALLTCPDLASAPGMPTVLRPVLGRSCRRVAAAQRAAAASAGAVTVGADGHLPTAAFGPDGFHPGPLGIAVLADRVDSALGSRIG